MCSCLISYNTSLIGVCLKASGKMWVVLRLFFLSHIKQKSNTTVFIISLNTPQRKQSCGFYYKQGMCELTCCGLILTDSSSARVGALHSIFHSCGCKNGSLCLFSRSRAHMKKQNLLWIFSNLTPLLNSENIFRCLIPLQSLKISYLAANRPE